MSLTSHEDLSLKYVLNVPSDKPDTDELPLVVIMHGRGADAFDLADVAPMMDTPDGCRFVFPNAPRQFEAAPGMVFGWSWFDGWPPQGSTFGDSRKLVLQFLDEIVQRYPTPPGKLVIGGFSQGALMALDIGFRTEQPVAGIVAMSGALHEADLPTLRPMNVLVVHGVQDDVIPVNAARRSRMVLEQHGVNPEYHEFPMGHFVTPESISTVRAFITRVVA